MEICSGNNLQLTCRSDTGTLVWNRVGGPAKTFSNYTSTFAGNQPSSLGDHITVYPTNVSSSGITSVANITSAPLALNGTVIQCRDNGDSKEKVIIVSGKRVYSISLLMLHMF